MIWVLLLSLVFFAAAEDRNYVLRISWVTAAPDGFSRDMILANGQFPGPTIEATIGDTLHVKVINLLNVSTTVHWHGLFQQGTPWYDGAVGFTQCPIPPGTEFTYVFVLQQTGTYWWHAHYNSQITDGLKGALIIKGNPTHYEDQYNAEYTLQLTDFYHTPALQLLPYYMSPASGGNEPIPDSGVMNGAGVYDCSLAPPNSSCSQNRPIEQRYATFKVTHGKKYRLRIINTATFAMFKFSIDNHDLTIIEVDGVDVAPHTVDLLSLNVAQRYSVILKANSNAKNYWIRAEIQTTCFPVPVPNFNNQVLGIINYDTENVTLPQTHGLDQDDCVELDQLDLFPLPVQTWLNYDVSVNWIINFANNAQGVNLAYMGNISYTSPASNTFSLGTEISNGTLLPNVNPYYLNVEPNATIQFILNNYDTGEHPIHLHGHNFAVLAIGTGIYNYSVPLKYINPPRRDVIGVPAGGFAVIRWVANNPGVWPFHCHIDWHFTVGLAASIIERPIDLKKLVIPQDALNLCTSKSTSNLTL